MSEEQTELTLKEVKESFKEVENKFVSFRDRLQVFKRSKFIIKLLGNIFVLYFLVTKNWMMAFVFWFLFSPDLNEVTKFLFLRR